MNHRKNVRFVWRNLELILKRVHYLVSIFFIMIVLSLGLIRVILVHSVGINCQKRMKTKLRRTCKSFWMVKLVVENFK
ncbi:hypothetical protein MTR67_001492 [Solanum verrucosum]|uniref:Uncharacterized protein n=1 Tax=Solanum verrucosum TaxID=315347 RepID=A0AAF0T537_SOLVR|nr:hypothetical protein MTR67_001492 [Solanum verrucosum]